MRKPPVNTIATDAIKAWKITAWIYVGILWLVTVGLAVLTYFFEFSNWFTVVALVISGLSTYLFVFLFPKLRWKRWRYEVFDQEIYIQHGILIVSRTLVPMIRVQHVDTQQGPILKKYQLASVTISTAATTHEIPALLDEDASELRDRISALARVDEDDV
ncbi:PH domain-containing protein [Virgibacillus litoralis]|uniref:Membrane protein YdbS with pleckstrin-like domain n=1 Tax=Virgibacillus litoralis TaxID=578221 RepID=A0ABS4HIK6_9BACI|nr:PH domain-containing protein [Virgibacillus litoralis]MBP1950653.1 membrane protein YdbS with pleckstrin-like domain [Virgibacillus litoralis]